MIKMTNTQGFSTSSLLSEDVRLTDERQVGIRKMDHMAGFSGMKLESIASSPYRDRIQMDQKMINGFVHPDSYIFHGRNGNFVGAERLASHSLPIGVDRDLKFRMSLNMESVPYFPGCDNKGVAGVQYENGLFSSSLSDVFTRNLKISSNHAGYSHSTAATDAVISHYDDCFDSLEELEAQTIGNLLPDDDELFSGVTDSFGTVAHHNYGEETEDLDFFSNVGGLELGEDEFSQKIMELSDVNSNTKQNFSLGSCGGEHPLGEHPSRTLFVRNINSNVEDSELTMLFEQYGAIRTLYTACKHRGFVMISYYDIRAACSAMKALQDKPLRRRKLDIHFSIPKENPSEKDINQGTLAISNLDSSISNDDLLKVFGVYGEVKEMVETPQSQHRYVEFYDVRAAEAALCALNRSEISGKQIKLEPAGHGGSKRFTQLLSELEKEEPGNMLQKQIPSNNLATGFTGSLPLGITMSNSENGKILSSHSMNGISNALHPDHLVHPGVSSSVSNSVSSLLRTEPTKPSSISDSSHLRNHLKFEIHGSPDLHANSLPEYNTALPNGRHLGSPHNVALNFSYQTSEMVDGQQFGRVNGQPRDLQVFGSPASGNCPPGHNYVWNNSCHPQPQRILWPSSPSYVNGVRAIPPKQLQAVPRAPHIVNSVLPLNNHHVGSAPSVNLNIWDRRHAYAGGSPDATAFHPGSLGNMRLSGNSPHPLDFVPCNVFPRACANGMDMSIPSKGIGLHAHHQRCMLFPGRGQTLPMLSALDSPNERSRNRRNEANLSQGDNRKQFELDLDRIIRGEDKRTTLMIKNIPNKYTSKMLLAAIDERHKGTYDFIYLPIDFKNKCNVGYAFINMTEPSLIVLFHKTFNGKKWEKFNSEKVASLAYARIQGKAALIAHFQNSSLMNEDKRCRPILFHTDGPNAGDQVPFPMCTNIRPRPGKFRTSSLEENAQDNSLSSVGDECCNGDSSSGSD